MTNWQEECSIQQPKSLELVNRNTYIQRRNIVAYERENSDGTKESGWKCESRFISQEDYNLLLAQEEINQPMKDNVLVSMAAQADIYEKLLAQEENQLTIMAAIADLYEMQNGGK